MKFAAVDTLAQELHAYNKSTLQRNKAMAVEGFDCNDPCMIKILRDPFTVLEEELSNNTLWPRCSYCKKWMVNSSHLTSDKHQSGLYWARVTPQWIDAHQRKHGCLLQPMAVQQPMIVQEPPRTAPAAVAWQPLAAASSAAADDVDWPPQHALEDALLQASQSQSPAPSDSARRRWSRSAPRAPVVIDISTDSDDDKQNFKDMPTQTTDEDKQNFKDMETQAFIQTYDMPNQTHHEPTLDEQDMKAMQPEEEQTEDKQDKFMQHEEEQTEDKQDKDTQHEEEQTEDKQDKVTQHDSNNKMPKNEVSTCEQSDKGTQISRGARARLPPILGTQAAPIARGSDAGQPLVFQ